MQPARDGAVLGDFGGVTFELRGRQWRFFRDGARFVVSAEGPDGLLHDYEVEYVLGVEPLQQYLVSLAGGRLQALSVAWDTLRKRWFFLHPGRDIPPTDWLHWSRPGQNWNSMCAACHSTNVEKGYDDTTDTFHTTFSEVAVGCEACHGPSSRHVAEPAQAASAPRAPAGGRDQVERCAPCHARRAQLVDGGTPDAPLLDRYLPVLLDPGVFHADGQILDEDFEYQSFTQSKMYARGVACGDCHDVHSGKLRATGNALCTRCHDKAFDGPTHHAHVTVLDGKPNPAAQCVSCHMPGQSYMVVHFRRDHSLRVPRPDLVAATGAPSACAAAGCHADRPAAWVVAAYQATFGKRPRASQPHWGTILAAGRTGAPATVDALAELAGDSTRPAIARATALTLLGPRAGEPSTSALQRALGDPDPLLRVAATTSYPSMQPADVVRALAPLLQDPIRAVRIAAAARLADVPPEQRDAIPMSTFQPALDEYIASMRYMSDLPSGPFNLGNLYVSLGRDRDAEREYRRAIAIDGKLTPAKVNLALLLARAHRAGDAEALLRSVATDDPGFATAAFNLGLLLAEEGQAEQAEQALRSALVADPTLASAAYNLALLIAERRPSEAIALLQRAVAEAPGEPRYAWSLAFELSRTGELGRAAEILEALLREHPGYDDGYLLLGTVYEQQKRWDQARALYRRAATAGLSNESRAAIVTRALALEPRRER